MPTTPNVPKETPMYEGFSGIPDWAQKISEAFKKHLAMSREWVIFFERLGNWLQINNELGDLKKATFGINTVLAVNPSMTNRFIAESSGTFFRLRAAAKQAPTGQTARITIDKSTDEGSTWNTIFADPGYVELAAGDQTRQDFTGVFLSGTPGTIEDGNFLRIGCLRTGSSLPGKNIEFVLRWE